MRLSSVLTVRLPSFLRPAHPAPQLDEAYDLQASYNPDDTAALLEAGMEAPSRNARRFIRVFTVLFALAIPATFIHDIRQTPEPIDLVALPNLASVEVFEGRLPQHNLELARRTRYVKWINQHHWGEGYNNAWEEFIILHEMARRANRSYTFRTMVFADMSVWPMNVFMSGPTAGGPWPAGVDTPLSISDQYWETACPPHRRRNLRMEKVNAELGIRYNQSDGEEMVSKWAKYLRDLHEDCISINGKESMFDLDFWFGSARPTALWPTLPKSPILTHHAWSHHVYNAVSRNLPTLTGTKMTHLNEKHADAASLPPLRAYKELPNLIALHIRRGDFEGHCWVLAHFAAPYASWSNLPQLPDRYVPDGSTQEGKMRTIPHCIPDPKQVAQRVADLNKEYVAQRPDADKLEYVYIMTNAKQDFLDDVRKELKEVGFPHMLTAKDLQLTQMENHANMVVDMEIGIRAALFIGNGFSTLTSTVAALRLVREAPLYTIRFW
ncbi:hypothetical protein AURDEDRAFT_179385 [Auricularia subglabra TFB-10046 SS5]|nr:hypothetical protein AURDEDRAFT_179385 [Auricularia subglabra TFB-10046 SS5]